MILLAFFFPLAVYLLVLGFLNRHRHPLLVSGVWDGIGLLFGVSGFLLFAGPAILSALNERWRLFWLLGKGEIAPAPESAWPMWAFLALVYFLLIAGGAMSYLWRQCRLTAIYNSDAETVERFIIDICKELGINTTRSGDLFLLGSRSGTHAGFDHRITAEPLSYGRGSDLGGEQPAILEVDSFPLMRHVTLCWEPAASPLRRILETELNRRLLETITYDGSLGAWLLTFGFLLLSFNLVGAFFLIILNLRPFLK